MKILICSKPAVIDKFNLLADNYKSGKMGSNSIAADEMVRVEFDHRRGDHIQKLLHANISRMSGLVCICIPQLSSSCPEFFA